MGKIIVFDTFGSSYRGDRKNEGSGNRDSSVVILKHHDLNRQPGKIRNLKNKQLIVPCTRSSGSLKPALYGAVQDGSFQRHHKNKSLGF